MGLLTQTAEPGKEVLGVERIAVVADRGYFKIEDIEACEQAGIEPYVPRPQRGPSVRAGLFRKDEFSYDPTSDSLLCPAGQQLHPYSSSLTRGLKKINYRNSQACRDCAIRSQCTGNQFRSVSRLKNEAVLDRMQACSAAPRHPPFFIAWVRVMRLSSPSNQNHCTRSDLRSSGSSINKC